ncbi:long-chain-fatty-acid--CoA ligase ACSBG2-like [Spea bombifrons]|uniref:long-chain-fatty-acid--CoA ligase ACSBG2-like n=1 Tax=Spea bombifrons TaxID=233779 RepID=UPI00234B9BC0|nr:long-chain-fatty-acid--CoA ligase ACSBG2-like [Spea bombifrons]
MSSPGPTKGDSEATTDSFVNISEYEDSKDQHQEASYEDSKKSNSLETIEQHQGPPGQEREKQSNEAEGQESSEQPQGGETQETTSREGIQQTQVSMEEEKSEQPVKPQHAMECKEQPQESASPAAEEPPQESASPAAEEPPQESASLAAEEPPQESASPAAEEPPQESGSPAAAELPQESGSPAAAELPQESGSPAAAEPPQESGSPAAAEPPQESGSPAAAEPPQESGSPAAAEPPQESGSPAAAEPPQEETPEAAVPQCAEEGEGQQESAEQLLVTPVGEWIRDPSCLSHSRFQPVSGWSSILAPADRLWTVHRDGAVRLRLDGPDPASFSPLTVPQLFARSVRGRGQQVALCVKRADEWKKITYLQYEQQTLMVAKALLRLGLQRFHGVLILGSNAPEWFMAEIGSILAGGLAVGVDPSCTAAFCQKVAQSCAAHAVFVQDHRQLRKILQVQKELPQLKAIIQWDGVIDAPHPGLYMWSEFMTLGSEVTQCRLNSVIHSQKANQCCAIIYPGAPTDTPRGVMLSHDNVTWMARSFCETLRLGSEDVVVSYLPLSNISTQMSDLWAPLCCGGATYFTEPDALKGSLLPTLRLARPTRFLGFPLLWEKIQRRWQSLEKVASPLHRRILRWARGIGLRTCYQDKTWSLPLSRILAEHLVFRPARVALGLDRCTRCYMGETPITRDTAEYFQSLGLNLLPWYGVNESCGAHSLAQPKTWHSWNSFGREIPGCRSRVDRSPGQGSGGLRLWGRHVFMGYLGMKEETEEALDEDGWLRSGDWGRLDVDGLLYVAQRGEAAFSENQSVPTAV